MMGLSVCIIYSPFSDRVGLPLHNIHIPSPFTSLINIFFVNLKFGHIRFHTLQPCLSRSSAFNHILHTFLHLVLITLSHHMSIPSQSTTPNEGCNRLNSNKPSQFAILSFNEIPHIHLIICISAPSNFNPTCLTPTSHAVSDTTGIHLTFHLQWGISGCQKWQKLSELHPSISDSSCNSKIRSTISIESVTQITKTLCTFICCPYTGFITHLCLYVIQI